MIVNCGYGTVHWYAVPGDREDGNLIARELDAYVAIRSEYAISRPGCRGPLGSPPSHA